MTARPRFTLRTLLILLTILGVALGFWAEWVAEKRRQARLLAEAWRMAEADGCIVGAGYDGDRFVGDLSLMGGAPSEQTAQALVAAKRILRLDTDAALTAEVQKVLLAAFTQEPPDDRNPTWSSWQRTTE